MNRKTTIQRIIAFLLLVIFTISITPESYFHSVLASHQDSQTCIDSFTTKAHFHEKKKECHFNQLVVTAPYIDQAIVLAFSVSLSYPEHKNLYTCSYQRLHFTDSVNRGPPQA